MRRMIKSSTMLLLVSAMLWLRASASASSNSYGHCPSSLTHDKYIQVLGNRCYRFFLHSSMEYWDAEKYCRRFGGHLAMPKNRQINNFLTYHLRYTYKYPHMVWIGLNDYDSENHFKWTDGARLGSFSNWADGDEGPRSGIDHPFRHSYEDCVMLDAGMSRGPWRDYRCQDLWIFEDHHEHFVCEFPLVPWPTQTSRPTTTPRYHYTTPHRHEDTTTHYRDTTTHFHDTTTHFHDTTTHFHDTTTRFHDTTTQFRDTTMTHFRDTTSPDHQDTTTRKQTTTTTTTTTTPSTSPTTATTYIPTITSTSEETTQPTTTTSSEATTSTTATVTTTTATPTTKTTTTAATTPQCSSLVCTKDCGMGGFLTDDNGCMICECDEG